MQTKFEFRGTGGELFKGLLKGWLLTGITLGIYLPWFVVGLIKLVAGKVKIRVGDDELDVAYTATGGELFKRGIVGYLLCMVTLGIYLPWFMVDMIKFHQSHMTAVRTDGRVFRLDSDLTGGLLFKTFFVNYLLTMVTIGIYMPWMLCNVQRVILGATTIRENDQVVGTVAYTGQGGELFKTFLVGYLLTIVTLGIYAMWFQVKLMAFFQRGTEITVDGVTYNGDYTATGGESFKLNFVGYLLTTMTLGIYMFWYMADLLTFQMSHTTFGPKGTASSAPKPTPAKQLPARTPSGAMPPARATNGNKPLPFGLSNDPADPRAAWARAFLVDANPPSAPVRALPDVVRSERVSLSKAPSIAPPPAPGPTPAPLAAAAVSPEKVAAPVIIEAPVVVAPVVAPIAAPVFAAPSAMAPAIVPPGVFTPVSPSMVVASPIIAAPFAQPVAFAPPVPVAPIAVAPPVMEPVSFELPAPPAAIPPPQDEHDTKMNLEKPSFAEDLDADLQDTIGQSMPVPDYRTELLPPRNPVGPAN